MGGPWCYINLKSWAYCDISVCKNKGRTPGLTSFKQKHEKVKTLQDEEHFYVTDLITIYQPITKYYTDYSTTTTTSVTTVSSFMTLSSTLRSLITTTRTATEYRTVFSPTIVRQTATKTVAFTLKGYNPQNNFYTVTEYSTTTSTPTVIRSTTRLAELAHYVRMIDQTSDNVKQFYTRCRYTAIRPTRPVIFPTDLKMICEQILYEKNNTVSVLNRLSPLRRYKMKHITLFLLGLKILIAIIEPSLGSISSYPISEKGNGNMIKKIIPKDYTTLPYRKSYQGEKYRNSIHKAPVPSIQYNKFYFKDLKKYLPLNIRPSVDKEHISINAKQTYKSRSLVSYHTIYRTITRYIPEPTTVMYNIHHTATITKYYSYNHQYDNHDQGHIYFDRYNA
ncbi:hypothetical protein TrispH2_007832 [Trichoplax sp. H2]|nr:hypothetical protein TrispH2_007832 [Trichoplax sp. H2]|eukprot:RDD38606.1 hypothetical protein TrispH2_007832 [Trichoplax sp. H2]